MTGNISSKLNCRDGGALSKISIFLSTVSIAVSVLAIWISYDSARDLQADEMYKDYLDLAIDHPVFAVGQSGDDYNSYTWFVSRSLFSFEKILNNSSDSWRPVIESQLCYHKKYFSSEEYILQRDAGVYDNSLVKMIKNLECKVVEVS